MKDFADFQRQAQPFIALFDAFCSKNKLRRTFPDHICYKCGSRRSFEKMRQIFELEGVWIYSSLISGRTIAYIRLPRGGMVSKFGPIEYLELSDQKPDGSQEEGFDHIEAYPEGWSYDKMIAALKKTEQVKEVARPHHTTHDVDIGGGFLFRATREPLIDKILREEMFRKPAL